MKNNLTKIFISMLVVLIIPSIVFAGLIEGQNTFQAELKDVKIITAFQGKALLAHFDPNYVIKLKLNDDSQLIFAIHSPTKLFGSGYKIGEKYNFTVGYDPQKDIPYRIKLDRTRQETKTHK